MLFLIILAPQILVAHRFDIRKYECKSAMNLQCKGTEWLENMWNTSCAIAAMGERIYNFGLVIHTDTCRVCRPRGTLGDGNVLEIPITGSLFVDGKQYQISLRWISQDLTN